MLTLNDAIAKKMEDPEFKAEWDALEPEFQIIRAIIEGREENDFTQAQLAQATGIHQADISRLENGTGNPSLRTLKRLAAGCTGAEAFKAEMIPLSSQTPAR